jgi:hypothetical protein
MISSFEIGWTAGFLEGEGSFLFNKGSINVVASQVQKEPLERLVKLYGGALYDYEIRNKRANPAWRWCLSGPAAVGLMMTLYKRMSPKRQAQIESALHEWKARPPATRYRVACPYGHVYDEKNTYRAVRNGRQVGRYCRACAAVRESERRRRLKDPSPLVSTAGEVAPGEGLPRPRKPSPPTASRMIAHGEGRLKASHPRSYVEG